jgi:hypothetical protein
MTRRLLFTVAVTCSLAGLYAMYASVVRPLVDLPAGLVSLPAMAYDSAPPRPVENVRIATAYLSDQPWTAKAKYHLRSDQTFIYYNEWTLESTDGPDGPTDRIRFQPFAMAIVEPNRQTGEERVVTVICESALVKFADSFEMPNPDPGRVVFAELDGPTRVSGPDGLLIDGKDFFFSESSAKLYSDFPVLFEYAGNRGSAEKLQIDLIPQEGVPRDDRPHVYGFRNVRLSKNVKMKLVLEEKGEPLELFVYSNSFDYDVLQRRAVYSTSVRASHATGPAEADWIECDRLTAEFSTDTSRPVPSRSDVQHLDRQLRFRRLQADSLPGSDGKRKSVKFFSHAHKLLATMETLTYEGEQRLLSMIDPNGVWIRQDEGLNQLKSPQVTLQLGEGGQLAGAWCKGPGWLVHRVGETSQVVLAADWRQELKYQPDPITGLDLWELGDSATFRQPAHGTALGADHIRLWVTPSEPSANSSAVASLPITAEGLHPRRMEAQGNVVLVSPRIEANCQHLEATIVEGDAPSTLTGTVQPASATTSDGASSSQPYHARADHIRVQLVAHNGGDPQLGEVWTEGRVLLEQPEFGRTIAGSRVHLQNKGDKDQVVHIFGKPAQLRDQGFYLEAHEAIHIDRAENSVWVNGPGALQFPLKNDLEGKPLEQPESLDVTWKERMTFDGTLAAFTGRATARMGDRQMTCQQMQVTLSDRVSFTADEQHPVEVQVAWVRCREDVVFKNFTYERQQLVEIQQAAVHELDVNRATGDMHAQGPGKMSMWRRGQALRAGLTPQQAAQANRPVDVEPAEWEFTHVKFDGRMEGNLERRFSSFFERVEIVHGPVAGSTDSISRDALPKGGAWMSCEELQVMQQRSQDARKAFVQLAGQGNCRLEGRDFYALSPQVIYDQSTGFYTLRGFGKNLAKLWRERAAGQGHDATVLQRMHYNPDTRELRADGVVNAEGSR